MTDSDRSGAQGLEDGAETADQLAASARGWHRIQLAVLGFIGFCGVLWDGGASGQPPGVQWLSLALVLSAFVLAVVAVARVGRVAYPFRGTAPAGTTGEPTTARQTRRLRSSIWATYVAVGLLVAATLPAWLPATGGAGVLEVGGASGEVACGRPVDAPAGEIRLETADGLVTIPLDRVALLRPVRAC